MGMRSTDRTCQAVYKGVRAWCRRTLEKAGERVMDVSGDGNDDNNNDDDDDNDGVPGPSGHALDL